MEKDKANILVIDDDYDVLKSAHVFLKRYFTDVQIEQVEDTDHMLHACWFAYLIAKNASQR